jgi:pyruvate,water dikinase
MADAGLPVPPGFIVCTGSFEAFLANHEGVEFVRGLTGTLKGAGQSALEQTSALLRDWILSRPVPQAIQEAIRRSYLELGANALVAVRSSAVSEDGETASFAGQYETFLNLQGADAVISHVRECWASLFRPRAIFYRARNGSLHDLRMAVVVQEMALASISGGAYLTVSWGDCK